MGQGPIPPELAADDQTITVAELEQSITRLTASGDVFRSRPDSVARLIIDDVGKHREPRYEEGAVYQDSYGEVWQYAECPGGNRGWRSFTDDPVRFGVPKRPLRKLVPEPPAPEAEQSTMAGGERPAKP
jgi:hypothetical protein